MLTQSEEVWKASLVLLTGIAQDHEELCCNISEDLFSKILDLMKSKKYEIHSMAMRFVSMCFSTDAVHLIDIGLKRDVLTNY